MILASNYRYCVEGGIDMPRKSTQTTVEKPAEQTAVDLGLILEDGQHQDDAAEREAMERGQAASEAMAADDEDTDDEEDADADAEAIQEEVDGVVPAWRDRNARIVAMRREGRSLSAIGQEFGL